MQVAKFVVVGCWSLL